MIPALVPDQSHLCRLCQRGAAEAHHVLHKSMGGTDHAHNLVDLCRECHNHMHPEKVGGVGWQVAVTDDNISVYDDGKLIAQRWFTPDHWGVYTSKHDFLAHLDSIPSTIKRDAVLFKYLDHDELGLIAQALINVGEANWFALGHLFRSVELATPYGSKTERIEAFAQKFDLTGRTARTYIKAAEVYEEQHEVWKHFSKLPTPEAVLLTATQGDPVAAIELYMDRVADNPHYSVTQLRADLKRGATSLDEPPQHHQCPTCGQWHLVRE